MPTSKVKEESEMVGEKNNSFWQTLYTKRLLLKRMTRNDWVFFRTISGDLTVYRYFLYCRKMGKELKQFFLNEIVGKQDDKFLSLVIRKLNNDDDDTEIGFLNMYYVKNGVWRMEYALFEIYRSQGYMTEIFDVIINETEKFLSTFNADLSMKAILLEVPNDSYDSKNLVENVIKRHKLRYEISTHGFYSMYKSRKEYTWYRINL